jgi:hypothetical protein
LGSGRLKVRTAVAPDGRPLRPTRIFDSVEGVTCTPWSVDGVLRCLPDAYVPYDSYEDSACERPVDVSDQSSAASKFLTEDSMKSCDGPTAPPRYFEIGADLGAIQIYSRLGTKTCMPLPGLIYAKRLIEHPLTDAPALGGE